MLVRLEGRNTGHVAPMLMRDIHSFYVRCEAGEPEVCVAVREDLGVVV